MFSGYIVMATAKGKRDLFATASRADPLSEKKQADQQNQRGKS
jgi:hypothetical protein